MKTRAGSLIALSAVLASCSPAQEEGVGAYDGPYRNVILITLDTLRADHLGCYGSDAGLTPELDAFAAEGVRFADVTTAAPTTLASHVSIMTGTYPHTHGVPRNGFDVLPENRMLAETLRERGFETAAFLGSWALDASFGFDQGFDYFDAEFDVAASFVRVDEAVEIGIEQDQRRAEQVNEAVFRYLDETDAERRFLFLHYFDAHAPYSAPAPFGRVVDGQTVGSSLADLKHAVAAHQARVQDEPLGFDGTIVMGIPRAVLDGADGVELPIDVTLKDDYAREVRYLDDCLGRLFAGLAKQGVLDDALVIVTADHGESFHEHGDYWNHGSWVYETTVRVPLLVWRSPNLRTEGEAGRAVGVPISTVDILPTVLAVLGIEPQRGVEGVALSAALMGDVLERGPVFCEATQPTHPDADGEGWTNARKARCVRDGSSKLILAPLLGRLELFDLASDPGERDNRATAHELADRRLSLQEALRVWSSRARASSSTFNPAQSAELLQRLRALGYPEGDDE